MHDAFAVVSQHQSMRHLAKLEVTATLLDSKCSELYLIVLGFFKGRNNCKQMHVVKLIVFNLRELIRCRGSETQTN